MLPRRMRRGVAGAWRQTVARSPLNRPRHEAPCAAGPLWADAGTGQAGSSGSQSPGKEARRSPAQAEARPASSSEKALRRARVILTFSGKVRVSGGSEIWSKVASVMKDADANIENAGGSFVRMPLGNEADDTTFSVSAFGACISPSLHAVEGGPVSASRARRTRYTSKEEDVLGCTMYVKAILPLERLQLMLQLLQTQSPLQVYTVSVSADAGTEGDVNPAWQEMDGQGSGTLFLFGVDRPGQLARITETLRQYGVSVLHLRVQSGVPDIEKCDFSQASGGPLAENRIRIVFDESKLDVDELRRAMQKVGQEVGYAVTCLTTDAQSRLRSWLPSYSLRRKAFTIAYLANRSGLEAPSSGSRQTGPRVAAWRRRPTTKAATKATLGLVGWP